MNILITGAAGFIGMHMVQRLLPEAALITGLDNINDYYDVDLKYARLRQTGILQDEIEYGRIVNSKKFRNYRFVQLSLEDRKGMETFFRQQSFDYIIALGAQAGVRYSLDHPHSYIDSNVMGFMNILEGCRQQKVKHLLYASTSSVYGLNTKIPFAPQDSTDHPMSLYAATKKANEVMAHSYSHLFGIPTTGLRFFTVYGPWGRPDMALYKFTKAILDGQTIDVYNGGDMLRDFTYVDDIVENVFRLLSHVPEADKTWNSEMPAADRSSAPYRILNIGNNKPVTLLQYIEALEEALGKKAIKNCLPMQPGDLPVTFADVDSLETITGYRPGTTLKDGVRKFVDWYQSYHQAVAAPGEL